MLALVTSLLAFQPQSSSVPTLMKLRGGMSLGPINPGNLDGVLKVVAAVTAAGAITEKYAGVGETTLTKMFKGDVWSTNLIISMVTGVSSAVIYSVGASPFDVAKLGAVLWLSSVLMKLKDANFDLMTLKDDPVETVVAALSTFFAFA
jgi:hypothetical protein